MTARSRKAASAQRQVSSGPKTKRHLDDLLDQALEQTFPASDTPALIEPVDSVVTPPAESDKTPA
jgi:hypothetical protein